MVKKIYVDQDHNGNRILNADLSSIPPDKLHPDVLAQGEVVEGVGITITNNPDGTVSVAAAPGVATSFRQRFTVANPDSQTPVPIQHNLGEEVVDVTVALVGDPSIPVQAEVVLQDENNLSLLLTGESAGEYEVLVLAGGDGGLLGPTGPTGMQGLPGTPGGPTGPTGPTGPGLDVTGTLPDSGPPSAINPPDGSAGNPDPGDVWIGVPDGIWVWDGSGWVDISGNIDGPTGPTGPTGAAGSGLNVIGSLPDAGPPPDPTDPTYPGYPTPPDPGDAWLGVPEGIWVWDGTGWVDVSESLDGPTGPTGATGPGFDVTGTLPDSGPPSAINPPGGEAGNPDPGDVWIGVPDGIWVWDGTGWVDISGNLEGPTGPTGPAGSGFTIIGTLPDAGPPPDPTDPTYPGYPTPPDPGDAWIGVPDGVWVWDGTGWVDVGEALAGPTGPTGATGPAGFDVTGTLPDSGPPSAINPPGGAAENPDPGDIWIGVPDGIWVWDGVGWVDISGNLEGPTGPTGASGPTGATGPGFDVTGTLPDSGPPSSINPPTGEAGNPDPGDVWIGVPDGIWVWDGTGWVDVSGNLEGPTGPTGATGASGPTGEAGSGINIMGSLPDAGPPLPPTDPNYPGYPTPPEPGDAWLGVPEGVWVWDGTDWVDVSASLAGPTGPTGPTGPAGLSILGTLPDAGPPPDPTDPTYPGYPTPPDPGDAWLGIPDGIWVWDGAGWVDVSESFEGPTGPTGATGAGFTFEGNLPDNGPPSAINPPDGSAENPDPGDIWIGTGGGIWVWDGTGWVDISEALTGPTGPTGPTGAGLDVTGTLPDSGPPSPTNPPGGEAGNPDPGDIWIGVPDGIWVWDGVGWVDISGNISGPTGPTGAVGSTGTEGPTGPQGVPGVQGVQGNPGAPGATGASGADGTIGPTGPSGTAGPTGASGASGAAGTAGPTGPTGASGLVGASGTAGPTGPTGVSGPQGIQGVQGTQGLEGPTGPAGDTGAQGTSVEIIGSVTGPADLPPAGPPSGEPGDGYISQADGDLYLWDGTAWVNVGQIVGPPGATGDPGTQGPLGPTGPQGTPGATGTAGTVGPTGPTGVGSTGPTGPAGASGTVGPSGTAGPTGPTGAVGTVGPTGASGAAGTVGPAGTIGPTGPQGNPGLQGNPGTVGPTGPTGPTSLIPGPTGPAGVGDLSDEPGNIAVLSPVDGLLYVPDEVMVVGGPIGPADLNLELWIDPLSTAGIEEVYTKPEADATFVNIIGDTMTGFLLLPTGPTAPLHAATKQYVDDQIDLVGGSALDETTANGLYVNIIGDTMTGPLVLPTGPAAPLEAATKDYVDTRIWYGSQAEYDAIVTKNPSVLYCIGV